MADITSLKHLSLLLAAQLPPARPPMRMAPRGTGIERLPYETTIPLGESWNPPRTFRNPYANPIPVRGYGGKEPSAGPSLLRTSDMPETIMIDEGASLYVGYAIKRELITGPKGLTEQEYSQLIQMAVKQNRFGE